MGTVTNPFGSLLNGMVQGHVLANQIKQQAMQEQAFQQAQADHQRSLEMEDIKNKIFFGENARPVNSGVVEDTFANSAIGDQMMQGADGLPETKRGFDPIGGAKFIRPVDKANKVTHKFSDGTTQDYELLSHDEQRKRALQDSISNDTEQQTAKSDTANLLRQKQLAKYGVYVPDDVGKMLGLPTGTKVMQAELPGLMQEAQKMRKDGQVKLSPGETLIDTNVAPGEDPKKIASGGPQPEDQKTRAARSYYASVLGKNPDQLTPKELAKGVQEWELATMNPLDFQLKNEELKAKPLDRAVKESTLRSQAIERTIKGQELELASDADTINMAATKYLQTGTMPSLGMGSSLLRGKIMGRAAELAKENGLSPEQVPALQDTYKSMSKSLSDLQTRKNQLEAFESGGAKNLDNYIALAQKQIDAKSPIVNRVLRGASRTITGNPDQAAADAARVAAYNEISKILSGSMGNAAVSDSARKEAEDLLNGGYTMKQLAAVAKVLRTDMKNRTGAYGAQIEEVKKQMQGLTKPGSAEPPTSGPKMGDTQQHMGATYKFDGAQWVKQ